LAHYSSGDPYTDPSTGVLFNLLGISDQAALDRAEADIVSARLVELAKRPISGKFDAAHIQAIHRHLFSDIYEWAGCFRTIGISKGNSMFCMPAHIDSFGAAIFRQLRQERRLAGLALPQFAERAAYSWGS
jgi:cell filamentation protein